MTVSDEALSVSVCSTLLSCISLKCQVVCGSIKNRKTVSPKSAQEVRKEVSIKVRFCSPFEQTRARARFHGDAAHVVAGVEEAEEC